MCGSIKPFVMNRSSRVLEIPGFKFGVMIAIGYMGGIMITYFIAEKCTNKLFQIFGWEFS